jgi:hypothetical protein
MKRILSIILQIVGSTFLGIILWLVIFICANGIWHYGQNAAFMLPMVLFYGAVHGFLVGLAMGSLNTSSILKGAAAGIATTVVMLLLMSFLLDALPFDDTSTARLLYFTISYALAGAVIGMIMAGILKLFRHLVKPKPKTDVDAQ